jgi:hypothetical protein
MLKILENRDQKEIERLLALTAERLLPHPGIAPKTYENRETEQIEDKIIEEIQAELNLDKNDQSPQTNAKLFEFIYNEMTKSIKSGTRRDQARARLEQKGYIHPSSIFNAQPEYTSLLTSLRPEPNPQSLGASALRERQTYWALGLEQFDSDDARDTITYQLDLLRAFSLSFPQDISLCYRLTMTENALTEDMGATFEIVLGGIVPKDMIFEQTEHFGRAYRAILVPGWRCYTSDAEINATGSCAYSIEPINRDRTTAPAIRSDWGRVVDVLRAQSRTMTLDLMCSPLALGDRISPVGAFVAESTGGQVPLGGPAAGTDSVRDFLIAQAMDHQYDPPTLELRILVSSAYELTQSLLNTLGSMLLGHDRFKVRPLRINAEAVLHTEKSVGFSIRADEALRIFHPPHGHIEGRGLGDRNPLILHAKSVPLTQSGCVIGKAVAAHAYGDTQFDLAVDQEARLRHVYVIGKTGSGKTNLLKNMVRQDITSGAGVVVIDPHGDLAEYALGHCKDRINECIYLDFADHDYLPVFNPLSLDIANEGARLLAVEELLEVFTRRTYHEWYGPRFEDTVRMVLDTLYIRSAGAPYSILDVPSLLRDKRARKSILESLPADSDLQERWRVFEGMSETEQSEVINWVLAKFAEIEQSEVLRAVLGAQQSSFSLAQVIAKRMVLIVRIPEAVIGSHASSFLSSLLVTQISRHIVQGSAGSRADDAPPIFMYVDEFQKFVGSGFESLIPEARKFGLGLVLAHQNIDQLRAFSRSEGARDSSVLTQILGNVGTIISFQIGSRDAELIGPELDVKPEDLLRIGRYQAIARVVANGIEREAVTISVYPAEPEPGFPETRERLRPLLRERGVLRAAVAREI